jgi:hypothetical protein
MDLIQVKRSTDEKTIFAFNYTKILGLVPLYILARFIYIYTKLEMMGANPSSFPQKKS